MNGPLEGIRIIDLTSMISGPVATMLLGDQGADVIKVESASGDLVRVMGANAQGISGSFLSSNRNKRAISIDLKNDEGKKVLGKLIETADVFVQNFRPGTAERMGIGEEALRAIKPDLIYVSISGFGEKGPYSKKRVYDPVIQALSGLAAIQEDRETGRPKMIRTIIPDKLTAMTAAQAITAALFSRERTGKGQHIKLAMLDAMVAFLWPEGLVHLTFPGGEKAKSRQQLAQDLIYETADDYITVGAVSDIEWQGLCKALENPEWLDDERYNTPHKRVVNAAERLTQTQEVLRTRDSEHWLKVLDDNDVPCAPILTRATLLDHPQIQANELVSEYEDERAGIIRQPRPAARFSETPAGIHRQAPDLGGDTREILSEAGFSDNDIDALYDRKVIS